jgi:hypothetical protein
MGVAKPVHVYFQRDRSGAAEVLFQSETGVRLKMTIQGIQFRPWCGFEPRGLSYTEGVWRYRLTVRTEPSQGLNTGSIPVSATNYPPIIQRVARFGPFSKGLERHRTSQKVFLTAH